MSDMKLPAPPVPATADLTDFKFMPLQVSRLRRSKAWLICKRQPELGFYMVNLWTAAWHSVPAGSLEDDDDVLADAAMCDPGKWKKLKAQIMRGWAKCSDGLLYHHVVAEIVAEAWSDRVEYAWKKETDRIRKENKEREKRGEPPMDMPRKPGKIVATSMEVPSDVVGIPSENALKGIEGKGEGRDSKKEALAPAPDSEPAKPVALAEASAGKSDTEVMDEARAIGRAFGAAQELVYGSITPRLASPSSEIRMAQRWVEELGMTSALAAAIFEAEMQATADKGLQKIQSMSYLDGRIRDSFAKDALRAERRQDGHIEADKAGEPYDADRDKWRGRMGNLIMTGMWRPEWGDKPCGVGGKRSDMAEYPEDLAVELGLAGEKAA